MHFADYFPVFDKLTPEQQSLLQDNAMSRVMKKGELVHNGSEDCLGLMVIRSGQLRAFMMSEQGREITLYRLFERDICLFSASCMMNNVQFDISIEAEKDTEVWLIPIAVYRRLMDSSSAVANCTNEIMGARMTDVMWLMEQVMWKSFDQRLASFLVEEAAIEGDSCLRITHEQIASHLGTAREVVTRMLKYFQSEGMVRLSRGEVEIADEKRLMALSEKR